MKKLLIAAAVAGSMLSASVFAANEIGTVNMQTVMTTAPQIKACQASLKKKFTPMQTKLQAQAKTLQADMKNYQKNAATMSKADLAKLQKKVQTEQAALQQGQAMLQQQAMGAQQACIKTFANTLKTAAAKVAGKKGLTVVLPSNAVIYSAANLDVTTDVLENLK
jgi:outer membrane protein